MRRKIIKILFIGIGIGIVIYFLSVFLFFGSSQIGYKKEYNQIKEKFNNIDTVKLLNIWGNKDLTYENISIRLEIENRGIISLLNLSEDCYNYPVSVDIGEFNGHLFFGYYCDSNFAYSHSLDIGTTGYLSHYFENEFNTPEEVISRYDEIWEIIQDSIPAYPVFGHYFNSRGGEAYICTYDSSLRFDEIIKSEKTFSWTNEVCIDK